MRTHMTALENNRALRARIGTSGAIALVVTSALVAALALTGCGGSVEPTAKDAASSKPISATFPVTVTDDASRTVEIAAKPQRIVSLAPANTEIVTAIGLPLTALVGVTTYDDYPVAVKSLPKMGDFMNLNIEAITGASPDLILATSGVQADVIAKLEATGAKVLVIDPQSLDGLYEAITMIGTAVGEPEGAAQTVGTMKTEIASIKAAAGSVQPVDAFVEIGYDPLFTAGSGTLIDDLISAAGGRNVVTTSGYVAYSVEQLVKDDPAVYLALKGTSGDPGRIESRAGYASLSAVKNKRVVVLEDNLVVRPGPRIAKGVRAIALALHPDAFGAK